jgi:hypothetical protein
LLAIHFSSKKISHQEDFSFKRLLSAIDFLSEPLHDLPMMIGKAAKFREIFDLPVPPESAVPLAMKAEPDPALIERVLEIAAINAEATGEVTPFSAGRENKVSMSMQDLMKMRVSDVGRKSPGAGVLGLRLPGVAEDEEKLGIEDVQELSAQGLAELVQAKAAAPGSTPSTSVANLKTQHHAVARLIATGLELGEVAAACGTTPARVSTLQRSPAFQNLVLGYQRMIEAESIDLGINIRIAAAKALSKVTDYLAQPVENLDADTLKEMTFGLLDRAGHSPVTKSVVATAAVSPHDLHELKLANAAGKFEVVDAIELEPMEVDSRTGAETLEAGSADSGSAADGDDGRRGAVLDQQEISGNQSSGDKV